ncbi:uncharacterized protein ZK1073.1 isoform X3 [Rhipicephalus sanguineus]|uniref:uncharacterized protein ZK1073.1 isoform X3 n=1 Tax=Rhipicephalus sanguineus TaxID=34632 RepID=UPI0018961330|nr:uncharacterized protein ZK1073.1 isoform X3 [Rhipicephalus sanguineus]
MCDSSKIPSLREQISEDCYTEAFVVKTPRCGSLNVHVQGDLSTMNPRKPIFLTVHDVGATYLDFVQFAAHPCMTRVCEKAVFLHIEVPGQAYNAPDLSEDYKFPSMDDLAQDMADVLHYFKVPYCVALGEGAGANILARFTVVYWYQGGKKSGPPPMEHFLVFHKFGKVLSKLLEQSGLSQLVQNTDETSGKVAQGSSALSYAESVRQNVNRKNSSFYIQAYLTRSDISGSLKKNLKTDILLVTSSTQVHADMTQNMYSKIDPAKAALLKLDDVEDILSDAPEKLAYSLVLFCQGLGLLSSLPITTLTSLLK